MEEEPKVSLVFAIMGDRGAGARRLVCAYTNANFKELVDDSERPEFYSRTIKEGEQSVELKIRRVKDIKFDTHYLRRAKGLILVYDITEQDSFDNLKKWEAEIEHYASDSVPVVLVGNKTDLSHSREVGIDAAKAYADKRKWSFVETSALKGTHVDAVFESLVSKAVENALAAKNKEAKERANAVAFREKHALEDLLNKREDTAYNLRVAQFSDVDKLTELVSILGEKVKDSYPWTRSSYQRMLDATTERLNELSAPADANSKVLKRK